jgi:NitT/TauT family transport system permease protein
MPRALLALVGPLVVVALLIGWEVAVRATGVAPFVLPAPSAIGAALVEHWPVLAQATRYTVTITWVALGVSLITGVALALLIHRSRLAEAAVLPIAIGLQVTPVVAIAPIVLLWTGVENPARALVLIAWIVAFFPVVTAMLTGLKTIPREWHDLFTLYRASGWQRFTQLEVPASLPALLGGAKIASGLSLIGAVVAEFVVGSGTSQGLAWTLTQSIGLLEIPRAFACLALLTGFGLLQYGVLAWIEARVLARRGLSAPL